MGPVTAYDLAILCPHREGPGSHLSDDRAKGPGMASLRRSRFSQCIVPRSDVLAISRCMFIVGCLGSHSLGLHVRHYRIPVYALGSQS